MVKESHWIQEVNRQWYYLDKSSGAMKTRWIKDKEKWYYLYSNGSLAVSDIIDGYLVNENEEWI